MPNGLEQEFRTLLSEMNRDVMKPKGWKRSGQNFRLILTKGMLTRGMIVNFQKSQWNNKDELRFTINAAWTMVVAGEIDPNFKEYDCHFSNRIRPQGLCKAYDRDQWWTITAQTDHEALKSEIEDYLGRYAIPWLLGPFSQEVTQK